MKVLLASAVLVFSTMASASTYDFKKGDNGLSLLTLENVQMISVETKMGKCPKFAMCEAYGVLTIKFDIGGCMDRLGPVTITDAGLTADGKKKLVVTAFVVNNEASKTVKCFRAPIGVATQVLGLGLFSNDSVEIEFAQSLTGVTTL